MNPYRLRAYMMLLLVSAIWGAAGPIIKYTLGGIEPLLFLTYRFALSTLVAIPLFLFFGFHIPKDKQTFLQILLYGFLTSTVSLGLLFFGLKNTTVLDMTLITLIMPLIASTAGVVFLHERVTLREKIGMGIAFLGTIITVTEPIINDGVFLNKLSGNILVFIYIFIAVWGAVMAKKLLQKGVNPLTMTNFSFIVGFITLLPFTLLLNRESLISNLASAPFPYHLGVIFMALISGNLAYFLANKAQKTIEIGEQALFSYLYPIFSFPLAVFWLKEKITPIFIVGAVIIAIGVFIAEVKKKRYNSPV